MQGGTDTGKIRGVSLPSLSFDFLNTLQNYLKPKDLKEALEIIKENKNEFERIWDEWFN